LFWLVYFFVNLCIALCIYIHNDIHNVYTIEIYIYRHEYKLSSTHENRPSLAIVHFQCLLFSLFSHKNIILVICTRQCGLDEVENVTYINVPIHNTRPMRLAGFFIVLAHWNNSLRLDTSLHLDTSWLRVIALTP
jgi:hypothetical protein